MYDISDPTNPVRVSEFTFPGSDFDSVTFVHHALSGIDAADVCLAVEVAGKQWETPLYINAMPTTHVFTVV